MAMGSNHSSACRSRVADPRDEFFFPPEQDNPVFHHWGALNSAAVATEIGGRYPPPRTSPGDQRLNKDERHAKRFIQGHSMDDATVPRDILFRRELDLEKMFPLGAPVVDKLEEYSMQ